MVRIIVAGGRRFNDYDYLRYMLDELIDGIYDTVEIVSGHARGADSLGELYAKEHGLKLSVFKADWNQFGNAAGYIRNKQMLNYAMEEYPIVAAFWDGESKGTKDMIERSRRAGANVMVFRYDQK